MKKILLPQQKMRRRIVQGLVAGSMLHKLPTAWADPFAASTGTVPELRGTVFDLVVGEAPVNFTGVVRKAVAINGVVPAPTLRMREGDHVTLRVTNRLSETTSIHWHGIILPYQMDGVPGISFAGIPPGETFVYQFTVRQSGTYWYHSHSAMQEAMGMYGALIIEPRGGESIKAERDHVLVFSDWTDESPMRVFEKLKMNSDLYNQHHPTAVDFFRDVKEIGWQGALDERKMWNEMRMSPTDLADLSSTVLTYLLNGTPPDKNWTGLCKKGERVRLRCINATANTFYDVRIPGLKLMVVQADGIDVDPVTVDEFRFGPGQTCDVVVKLQDDAYTIYGQSMDRTGFARATLATRMGLSAPVPAIDAVQELTMQDMMGNMMYSEHNSDGLAKPSTRVRHARTEYGASVDMRVDTPRTNLDDPGVGLRDNGRRVLTLADLHSVGGPLDAREPGREIELHLTGHMQRYVWSFDGQTFGSSVPVHFRYGERLRVILQNDTMMTHPMHLHGMWSELETDQGAFQARLHTIPVQPAQRISFLVNADALGRWAWHCHLLFHMEAGMFREVVVS